MTTTTDRAAGRMPRAAARCATTANEIAGVTGSGFIAFCAGAALIAYHVVGTSAPGRLASAAVAAAVFLADRFLAERFPARRVLLSLMARVSRHSRSSS